MRGRVYDGPDTMSGEIYVPSGKGIITTGIIMFGISSAIIALT